MSTAFILNLIWSVLIFYCAFLVGILDSGLLRGKCDEDPDWLTGSDCGDGETTLIVSDAVKSILPPDRHRSHVVYRSPPSLPERVLCHRAWRTRAASHWNWRGLMSHWSWSYDCHCATGSTLRARPYCCPG